jgi:hypothetical protein
MRAVHEGARLRARGAHGRRRRPGARDHHDRQAGDRKTKGRTGTKRTKTKRTRTVDIEPHLYPLVQALVEHPEGKGDRLLRMPPPEDRAELLRKDLVTVGVLRPALHVSNELERAIVFHDLRDTGLTHMAVRGDSPIFIQWSGWHSDFKTTQSHIDRGRVEAWRIGAPAAAAAEPLGPLGGFRTVSARCRNLRRKHAGIVAFCDPNGN